MVSFTLANINASVIGRVESASHVKTPNWYFRCSLLQSASPNPSNGTPHRVAPERPPKPKFSPKPANGIYPQIGAAKDSDELGDRDYEVLNPNARIKPTRPAPQPPTSSAVGSTPIYGTLPGSSDLDGVPFALNPRLTAHSDSASVSIDRVRSREEAHARLYV